MRIRPYSYLLLLAFVSSAATSAFCQLSAVNMLGKQSQNIGLMAVPVLHPVTIDGKLDEWDRSGRIWSFADFEMRDQYSVDTAAMWDSQYLYLSLKWKDPTPLMNGYDPHFNPEDAWKGDALQLRLKTDQVLWLTAWRYSPDGSANLQVDRWNDPNRADAGTTTTRLFGKPSEVDLGEGVQIAYRKEAGGYTQEMRLPWTLLYRTPPQVLAGVQFRMGLEFAWGQPSGKGRPEHHYVDNMQPGSNDREFFWTAQQSWGNVELVAHGGLALRTYEPALERDRDAILKIRTTIPMKAKRFTLVIEDQKGVRVRNLLADRNPTDFAVGRNSGGYAIEASWDGRDDEGKPVRPGVYRTRGLWHEGLDATYDMSFYNPGTPAWGTPDGSGAWGADHYAPHDITAAGDWMIVSWGFAEGGSGIIGIDQRGRKRWGELRGSQATAANSRYVFSIMTSWHGSGSLCRYEKSTGGYAPFQRDGQASPFELPLADIIPNVPQTASSPLAKDVFRNRYVLSIAANERVLVMGLADHRLAVLDTVSGKLIRILPGITAESLALDARDNLYAIADNGLSHIDLSSGSISPVPMPTMGRSGAISVSNSGDIAVLDLGSDQQVKIYSPEGRLLATRGKKGGRSVRGEFDREAMSHVSSIAFDFRGNLWAIENWNYPRRISVWAKDGALVNDYIGNTGYAGGGAFLHATNPSLGYVGPVEIELNHRTRQWSVAQVLWKADPAHEDEPASFDLDPLSFVVGQRFSSAASGRVHEYLFKQPVNVYTEPSVLFMKGVKGWRPVSALGLVGQISGQLSPEGDSIVASPQGAFADLSAWDRFLWNDNNKDGRVQREECQIIKSTASRNTMRRPAGPNSLAAAWNNTMDSSDLSFLTTGIYRYKPLRYDMDGAPFYSVKTIDKLLEVGQYSKSDPTTLNPVVTPDKLRIIVIKTMYADGDAPAFFAVDAKTKGLQWSYPNLYPGVQASHKAPMPSPGLLLGVLKVNGAAKVSPQIGSVLSLRGNLGQDYFMTTDGLYVGALFRDTRLPSEILPATEDEMGGKSLVGMSDGSEPFGGWFGRQSDGVFRLTTSIAREAALVVDVRGLETIHRYDGPAIEVSARVFSKAKKNANDASASKRADPVRVVRIQQPLSIDDSEAGWKKIPSLIIARQGSPEHAECQLAHDETFLYVRFFVKDASPLLNLGDDFSRLFKTGDAVDIQFGPAQPGRSEPTRGDTRVVMSVKAKQPLAVLMRPVDKTAPKSEAHIYTSPVGQKVFDRVQVMTDAKLSAKTNADGYVYTAAIPLADLGIDPGVEHHWKGDVGFISSDTAGHINIARTYLFNQDTGLVSDEPEESWTPPDKWGEFFFE